MTTDPFSSAESAAFEQLLADRLIPLVGATLPEPAAGIKCSAVLVPMVRESGEWSLLYTRRCDELADHGGQIAFPGGQCEDDDLAPFTTALREAQEELGIPAQSVRLLGLLDSVDTTTGFLITPVVGILDWPLALTLEEKEVRETFTVPLAWLRTAGKAQMRPVPDRPERSALFFEPFDGRIIWGATAAITQDLLKRSIG
jgi:8-oxo-dGTP pyrophosphatase MutT (NUDIX family)